MEVKREASQTNIHCIEQDEREGLWINGYMSFTTRLCMELTSTTFRVNPQNILFVDNAYSARIVAISLF